MDTRRYLAAALLLMAGLTATHAHAEPPPTAAKEPTAAAPTAAAPTAAAPADNAAADATAAAELERARVSLSMRDAPLLQILKLLSAASPARFRYGAPPDAVLSPDLNDELVLPALEKLLRDAGWQMRRDGADIFLLPGERRGLPSLASWSYWSGGRLPQGWLTPPVTVPIRTGAMQTLGEVPRLVAPSQPLFTRWKPLPPRANGGLRPGLQVDIPDGPGLGPLNLRWRMPLRTLPANAQLLLELPAGAAATLYVNGAPLLRNFSGLKLVDLSRSLQAGENVLGLTWRPAPLLQSAPPSAAGEAQAADTAGDTAGAARKPAATAAALPPAAQPTFLLRYEWFFEGTPGPVGVVRDDN